MGARFCKRSRREQPLEHRIDELSNIAKITHYSPYCQIKIICYRFCADLGLVSIAAVGECQTEYRDLPNLLINWSEDAALQV
jgi:hypothetical protein